MTGAATRRDPAGQLRHDLIEALIKIPIANSLTDRRLLISLVRRDVANFPDVHERPEARLHVVGIVMACLEHPASLRALREALRVMAPDESGTRRACQLIESASLLSLLPDNELKRGRELLRRVAEELPPQVWRPLVEEISAAVAARCDGLVGAFDDLAATGIGAGRDGSPAALILAGRVGATLADPLGAELADWLRDQVDFLELAEEPFFGAESATDAVSDAVSTAEAGPPGQAVASPVGAERAPLPDRDADLTESFASSEYVRDGSIFHHDLAGADAESGDAMRSVASTGRPTVKLPQVWGDVPPRNPNFTGREALLDRLHRGLRVARETAVLPQALHGMGGVGKSQVAIEYVHRHSREFDLIWWIPAEQSGQILTSLTKLAQRLGLDVSPEANSAVPAVREALSTGQIPYENWLLIFDNAESLHDVRSYFPTGGAGKILVTSRNPEWAAVARALEVDVFTREESKEFLTNRTPELSDQDADRLAEALGDLPLAVEQAAAWTAATGMPVDEYLALLEEKRIELLDDTASPDYQVSVAAAWNVSLDKLQQVNVAALQLLQVCSFFAPEPISREFFAGSPIAPITDALDATLTDSIKLGRAIRDIQRYALAKFDHRHNTLQMHRLVQAVLVGRMDDRQREVMQRGAHTLLASANPHSPGRRTRWDRYQALLPHVIVSRVVESTEHSVLQLVFETVEFLYHWGDHDGCRTFAEQAYRYRLRLLGENDPQTLKLAKYLGYLRFLLGDYAGAAELYERAAELYTEVFGPEDEGTLDAELQVAIVHRTRGDFARSKELDERTLATCRRIFGADDPVTLSAAHNLGVSLRLCGEYAAAARLDEDTHRRRQQVFGGDDATTLYTLDNLNIDLRESGRFVTAHERQEQAYRLTLEAFGSENPSTMRAARNLAVARRMAGDHPAALKLAEETVEKYRRRYGDDYPHTMAAALNLAVDLRHAGDLTRSRELGESTLARYQRIFDERHPHTLSAQVNLAVVLRLLGEVDRAFRMNRQALDLLVFRLGPDHPVTLACATNLASDLFALGDAQAAYTSDTDTMARSERVLGVEHPSTLAVGVNLALDLRALDREKEADLLHAGTMSRFRRALGGQHPATLNALKSLRADCDLDPMPL